MNRYRLQRIQHLPVSREQAWRFFSCPLNLPTITPPWLNLTPLGKVPERMYTGMVIRYRVTPLLGIPVTWISEITHLDPPHAFVDEQRIGPYRLWRHRHAFRPVKNGIEMTDTVRYAMKYGPLGSAMHAFIICKRLEEIFDYRQKTLERLFGFRPTDETR
jgi:ligand-binding SRPBCC domain-containing protein